MTLTKCSPFKCFVSKILVSLTNGRPSAQNFSYADTLKSFMKATAVRLRLLRTKTLLGHLMAKARQDPTVTRRVSAMSSQKVYLCEVNEGIIKLQQKTDLF